ncbi:MAG: hypothetical protein WA885_17450 [Phormidesmis sp.]
MLPFVTNRVLKQGLAPLLAAGADIRPVIYRLYLAIQADLDKSPKVVVTPLVWPCDNDSGKVRGCDNDSKAADSKAADSKAADSKELIIFSPNSTGNRVLRRCIRTGRVLVTSSAVPESQIERLNELQI